MAEETHHVDNSSININQWAPSQSTIDQVIRQKGRKTDRKKERQTERQTEREREKEENETKERRWSQWEQ